MAKRSKNKIEFIEDSNVVESMRFNQEEAQEFQALLNQTNRLQIIPVSADEETEDMSKGLLRGRIVEITNDHVIVDVGLKSEGMIPIEEFSDPSVLALDEEVEVFLDRPEDESGQIVLSREKAERLRQWDYIIANCEEGSIVKGKVLRKVKGGVIVDIGMEAFLPGSQIDNKRIKNLDEYIGNTYEFKILKINIERKNVVVSRRELLEAERINKKSELLEFIQPGELREGVVKNITDFGVFLDLDGIDGLLHITDMTWRRIKHPSEMVELGQKLEVLILGVDKEKGRVALGLKQKEANPWEIIEEKYPPGTRLKGKIVNLVPYGAFIELEDGIEGLIHISEMSWVKNVTDPSEIVKRGDLVEAVVLSVQKDEGKISLGMKQIEHNPWDDVPQKYPVGSNIRAEIKSLTNYGVFVELEPGVEGLIHISDLSWVKKVSHPSEIFKRGDVLDAQVLTVDTENKRITLGVKQLNTNPWDSIEKTLPIGSMVNGVVTKITAFGAFVKMDNDMEGLVYINEISDEPITKIEDVISKDMEVVARVVKIDPENKKISLSLKKDFGGDSEDQDDILIGSGKKKKNKN